MTSPKPPDDHNNALERGGPALNATTPDHHDREMSDFEYADEHKGYICPYCRLDSISSDGALHFSDGNCCSMNMRCDACRKEWRDDYQLVGYSEPQRR